MNPKYSNKSTHIQVQFVCFLFLKNIIKKNDEYWYAMEWLGTLD